MASQLAYVKPEMLTWARTTANLEPIAASRKIGVPDERVEAWERGEQQPTITQLRKAAGVYRRTLAVFYLPEPPKGFETLRDFRRIDPDISGRWSAALHAEYRRAHYQRDALLEIAEMGQEPIPPHWRISPLPASDEALASTARAHLIDLAGRTPPGRSAGEYEYLGYWTRALEDAGVLVMTTEGGYVDRTEMRAFSLYFDEVPVIMLNGAEHHHPRLFSLLHEYVHLLLHTEGLCDMTTDEWATSDDRRLEARCNRVAAEALIPANLVLSSPMVREHEVGDAWPLSDLLEVARPFGVSAEAILRRLVTLGRVPLAAYQAFRKAQQDAPPTRRKGSGGSFYRTKVRDLGKGYVRHVTGAHTRSLIDSATTAAYLDAKVGQISRLADAAGA